MINWCDNEQFRQNSKKGFLDEMISLLSRFVENWDLMINENVFVQGFQEIINFSLNIVKWTLPSVSL